MRIVDQVGVLDLIAGRTHSLLSNAISLPTTSPYSPAPQLPQFVITDLYSADDLTKLPMTREEAIRIPAVSKARNLLISTIGRFPLVALSNTWRTPDAEEMLTLSPSLIDEHGRTQALKSQPTWLYRTNTAVSPYERIAWTVDDLIFYGVSLWLLDRGIPDAGGNRAILNASWCPTSTWSIQRDDDGQLRVHVDGVPIADDRYMLINSPYEGLLTVGQRTLRGARDIEESWVGRARNPIPLIDLHRTDDDELNDDELKKLVDAWAVARTGPNGAIGSTPSSIDLRVLGDVKPELAVEGRNAVRTDIGSHVNIRASMLDGTMGIDSLTYTTAAGEKNSFYEFDLPFWTDPIVHRMSLDDIVPRGTRIRFDMYSEYNQPASTGAPVED